MSSFSFTVPNSAEDYASRWKDALVEAKSIATSIPVSSPHTRFDMYEKYQGMTLDHEFEATLLRNVHPDEQMRKEAKQAGEAWNGFKGEISLSAEIYDALSEIPLDSLEATDKEILEGILTGFKSRGVNLENETREKIKTLQSQIIEFRLTFDKNITEGNRSISFTPEQLQGVPERFLKQKPVDENGRIVLTSAFRDFSMIIQHAKSEDVRKRMTSAYKNVAYPENVVPLISMLSKRNEMARLSGYSSYADWQLGNSMLKTAADVHKSLDDLSEVATTRIQADLAELAEFDPSSGESIKSWNRRYLETKLQKSKHAFDSEAARQYLPFDRTKEGVLASMENFFGITLEPVEVATWHSEVETYNLYDPRDEGAVTGRVYLDLHSRNGKYTHNAMFGVRRGFGDVLPEAALVCNFPSGKDLMTVNNIRSFFHEMGHTIHHILARNKRFATSGIPSNDFDEIPSQVLEALASHKDTLKSFAKNAAGETIPDDLIEGLQREGVQGRGLGVSVNLVFSALSLALHDGQDSKTEEDNNSISKEVYEKYLAFPYPADDHVPYSIYHLGSLGAKYYGYPFSNVIAQEVIEFMGDFDNRSILDKGK